MTIVGFEKKKDGTANLIVWDPMFKDAVAVTRYVGHPSAEHKDPAGTLRDYRRGPRYLGKYREFEFLRCVDEKLFYCLF
jgi:hypothetical protein